MTGSHLLKIHHFCNLHHFSSASSSAHNITGLARTVILCPHGERSLTLARLAPAQMPAMIPDPGENKSETCVYIFDSPFWYKQVQ